MAVISYEDLGRLAESSPRHFQTDRDPCRFQHLISNRPMCSHQNQCTREQKFSSVDNESLGSHDGMDAGRSWVSTSVPGVTDARIGSDTRLAGLKTATVDSNKLTSDQL